MENEFRVCERCQEGVAEYLVESCIEEYHLMLAVCLNCATVAHGLRNHWVTHTGPIGPQ